MVNDTGQVRYRGTDTGDKVFTEQKFIQTEALKHFMRRTIFMH